ncbi:MAG: tandem-95 repeat protein [Verrucomicrobia bacterium]|nr:tandem-95 repeat protein [Verrucomicrobiota bacterium]
MSFRTFFTVCAPVLALLAGGLPAPAQQLNQAWAARYNNGPVVPTADTGARVLADGAGNTFVVGSSGGGTATNIVVVKYNNLGTPQWTNRYFGPVRGVNVAVTATLDNNTNLIVAGYSQGAGTALDMVTLKFSPAGTLQWANRYDGPANGDDQARGVALDGSGNVFVGGFSQGIGTSYDYAVIMYSPSGTTNWVNRYNGPAGSSDQLTALAADSAGAVIVTGQSTGSGSGFDYATIKYTNGVAQWTNRYTSPGNRSDTPTALFVNSAGTVYVTGGSFLTNSGAGSVDYLTIQYNSTGTLVWSNRYNGTANSTDTPYAVAADASGNVFVAGASQSSGASYDMATVKYDVNGVAQWTNRYDSAIHGSDQARALAIGGSGDAYVAGYSENSFGGSDYTLLRITSATGANVFAQTYDGPAGSSDDTASSVALDALGNIYVTGTSTGVGTGGDIATLKYDAGGSQQWVARFNDAANGSDEAVATATDSEGNIYVAGKSVGAATGLDFVVIKHSAAGLPVWTNRYNGPGNGDDVAVAMAVNAAGSVFLAGSSEGSIVTLKYALDGTPLWTNFYAGPLASSAPAALTLDAAGNILVTGGSLNASGNRDYLTLKISTTNGTALWTNRYDGPGANFDEATALALDAGGNALITGNSISAAGDADFATIKINGATGNNLWVARYNGPVSDYDLATAIAVDASGNVLVAGASFGAGFNNDYAVLKYSSNGSPQWTNRFDGPVNLDDEPRAVAVDTGGNVYVTGYSFGSDPLNISDPNGSVKDFATIKYSSAGVALWTNRFNGPATNKNDEAAALAVDAAGNVYVTGPSVGPGTVEDYATVMYNSSGAALSTNRYNGPASLTDWPVALRLRGRYNVFITGRSVGVTGDTDFATVLYYQTNVANAAPTAAAQSVGTIEDVPLNITLAGTDANGDPLHYIIISAPTNGTLTTLAPNVVYVPDPGYYGPDSFTFRTSDGLLNSTSATVSITVSNVNSPPVLGPFVDLSFVGVTSPQVVPFTISHPANESSQIITVTATSSNPGLIPSPLGVTYASGNASGTINFTPVANAIGSAVITVTASDNGGTAIGGADRTVQTFVVNAFRPLVNLPRDGFPVANNTVNALLETNGILYMGGAFTELGTNTGRAAAFRTTDGAPVAGFPVIERAVQSVVSDGAGGWYVGGDFITVGGLPRSRLARILASGALDTNFIANVDSTVSTIFLSGTNLFIGGSFARVTNVTAAGVPVATNSRVRFAVLDKDTGEPRDLASNPQFNQPVLAIQPFTNDVVFVGGLFSNIINVTAGSITNTNQRINLAAISLTNGLPTAFLADCNQTTNGASTNAVRALGLLGTNLYVGGDFAYITNNFNFISNTIVPPTNGVNGVEQRTSMARLDALSGTVITNFRASFGGGRVRAIVASGSNVYAGGEFLFVTNRLPPAGVATNRNRLAALNFSNGVLRAWDPSVNGTVRSMALFGNNMFVGGDFTTVNTNLVSRRRFAAFGTNVNLVGTNITVSPINPNMGDIVNAVAVAGNVAFIGGNFTFYGGTLRSRAAAVDLSTFEILPWRPDPDNTVLALTMVQTNLVLGGSFLNTRFGAARRLAVVDTIDGAFRPGFTNGNCDNTVNALASAGNRLFVGGTFTIITNRTGGFENSIFRLAAMDFDRDGGLAPGFSADVLGASVAALAVAGGTLYVGGDYTNIASVARTRLAAVDTGSGNVLPEFVCNVGPVGTTVSALLPRGTNLYVGGTFTQGTNAGFVTFNRNRLMAVNPASGGVFTWNPSVNNGAVSTIAAIATNIYVGGSFSGAASIGTTNTATRNRIAEISISTALATPWNPDYDSTVNALTADEGRLFVGGAYAFNASTAGSNIRLRPFLSAFDSTGSTNNVAPIFNFISNFSLLEDAAATNLAVTGISAGPTNEFSQTLTLLASSSNPALIPNPVVTYASPGSTGSLLIAPVANASGLATITVTLQDSGGTASGGVDTTVNNFVVNVLSVNDTPTLTPLAGLTLNEDPGFQTINLAGITSGTANESSQTLTVTATSTNPAFITALTVNYNSPATAGTLTFTPAVNASGVDTITVVVSDNGGTANGAVNALTNTFLITVNAVNDAPNLNFIANRTTNQNSGPITVNLTGLNPGPLETNQTITSVTATSSNPGLVPNPIAVTYSGGTTGLLTFAPVTNASGTTTISVVVMDNGGTANGGRNATTNTFTVAFVPVNLAPTLNALTSVTLNEEALQQTVNLAGIGPGSAGETGQGLTVTAFSGNTNVIPNPSVAYTSPNATGTIAFTPLTNANGTVTISVIVTDTGGTANGGVNAVTNTFTVTLTPINDPPLLTAVASLTVAEDAGLQTIALAGLAPGPTNESAQTLTLTATSSSTALIPNPSVIYTNGNATGALNFTSATNATGTATITLVVTDNGGTANGGVNATTNTFTLTVSPINDPPALAAIANVTVNEDAAPQTVNLAGLAAGPANEAGQTFSVTAITSSDTSLVVITATNHAVSATTGSLIFRPVTNAFGTATISVVVTDNGGTAGGGVDAVTNTFAVIVNAVNDAPALGAIIKVAVNEEAAQQTVNVTGINAGPASESGQTLTLAAVSSDPAIVPNPAAVYTGGSATGSLTFTPVASANGTVTVTVTVSDNGGTANGGVSAVTNTFTITVNAVNDAPTLAALGNLTVAQDAPAQTVNLAGISAGPANENSQTLTVTAASSAPAIIPVPATGYTNGNAIGVLTFTPAPGTNGTVTLSVVVTDSGGTANGGVNSVTNTFTVLVQAAGNYSLVINRGGGWVSVAWPTNATGFVLQSSDTFSLWSNVGGTPVVVSNQNVLTNSSLTATNLFYRLRKP